MKSMKHFIYRDHSLVWGETSIAPGRVFVAKAGGREEKTQARYGEDPQIVVALRCLHRINLEACHKNSIHPPTQSFGKTRRAR